MNYDIKQSFTARELQVGDLMYDALKDTMVRVAYIGSLLEKEVPTGYGIIQDSHLTSITTKVQWVQIVLEQVEEKTIYTLDVIGKVGNLPLLDNGKARFRHLIKFTEPITFPDWTTPCYPNYPNPGQP